MIPEFKAEGYLPEGIHDCTLQELEERFTFNLKRKILLKGLKRLIEKLGNIHCKVIYIDGSFVSDKQLPSDVDVCFDCADLQEVIEIFSDMTLEDIKDYKLILGSDILNEASWDERGEFEAQF